MSTLWNTRHHQWYDGSHQYRMQEDHIRSGGWKTNRGLIIYQCSYTNQCLICHLSCRSTMTSMVERTIIASLKLKEEKLTKSSSLVIQLRHQLAWKSSSKRKLQGYLFLLIQRSLNLSLKKLKVHSYIFPMFFRCLYL